MTISDFTPCYGEGAVEERGSHGYDDDRPALWSMGSRCCGNNKDGPGASSNASKEREPRLWQFPHTRLCWILVAVA